MMEGGPDAPPGFTAGQQREPKLTSRSLGMRRISTTHLFPELRPSPRQIPLSILDTISASFPPGSAVWLYDQPADELGRTALTVGQLQESLQKTLNAYPQWAGQLQFVGYKPSDNHTPHRRVVLSYGKATDPGVELIVAHCPRSLASLIPSVAECGAGIGWWDVGGVSLQELIPEFPGFALSECDKSGFDGLPGMVIQLTTFDCGGVAVAIQAVHCLADAHTMVQFINDWARVNRAMLAHAPIPPLVPIFDPSLLDQAAAGNIDADMAEPDLIEATRALPIRCFPPPAPANGNPPSLTPSTPTQLASKDSRVPVGRYLLYFSPEEVQRIWEDASIESSGTYVTRFAALAALLWSLMMRNRELGRDQQTLDIPMNFRSRLFPALPETFIGSPTILATITGTKSMSLQTLANCTDPHLHNSRPPMHLLWSMLKHTKPFLPSDSGQCLQNTKRILSVVLSPLGSA